MSSSGIRPDTVQQEVLDDKVIGVAKTGIKSSRDLFISKVAAKCIGLVGVPVTARLMGAWDYGTYRKIMIPISLFMVLADLGMTTAITRYVSYYESKGHRDQGKRYLTAGAVVTLLMTLCMALSVFLFSRQISMSLFREESYASLVRISSLLLIANMAYTISEAAFLGMRKTNYLIIVRPFRSAVNNLCVLSAILLGYGVPGALEALIFSEFITALLCTAFLARERYLSLKLDIGKHVKELMSYGLPLYAISLSVTAVGGALNWMLAYFIPNDMYGLYSVAMSVVSVFQVLVYPVRRSLLPVFSDSFIVDNMRVANAAFKRSIKYISIFVLPLVFAFMTFAEPAVLLLFGTEYRGASLLVQLYMLRYLFIAIGSWSMTSFLKGCGDTRTLLRYCALCILTPPLTYYMTANYGIIGFLLSSLIPWALSEAYGLYLIHKRYGLSPDFGLSVRILGASLASSMVSYIWLKLLSITNVILMLLGAVMFSVTYSFFLALFRIVSIEDLMFMKKISKILYLTLFLIISPQKILHKLKNMLQELTASAKHGFTIKDKFKLVILVALDLSKRIIHLDSQIFNMLSDNIAQRTVVISHGVLFSAPDFYSLRAYAIRAYAVGKISRCILKHLKCKPGDVFLEVGAFIGRYTIPIAKRVGDRGIVIAVEAHPTNFSVLVKNIRLNSVTNVIPLNIAVGSYDGEIILWKGKSSSTHSITSRSGKGIKVRCYRVDKILETLNISHLEWVLIDVEGELEVLKGMINSIKSFRPVIIAGVSHKNLKRVKNLLDRLGYIIKRMPCPSGPRMAYYILEPKEKHQ